MVLGITKLIGLNKTIAYRCRKRRRVLSMCRVSGKKMPAKSLRANSHRCITQKVDVLKQSVDSLFR